MKRILLLVALLSLAAHAARAEASPRQDVHREFTRTKEHSVRVVIDVAFGSLTLERVTDRRIATVDYDESQDDEHKVTVSYEIDGDEGVLKVRLKKSSHFWGDGESDDEHQDRHLTVRLTNELPLMLDVQLGAGRGEIDLSELQVHDLKISTGASSVTLRCDTPNQIAAGDVQIESGVSKFTASNLSNLNFQSMKFSGGVGSYKLDFSGSLRRDADVKVEVGLGSIVVNIPRQIPARLFYDDSWLSSFDLDDAFEKERNGVYQTSNFTDSSNRLTVRIESGLGSVKVRRR